MLLTAAISLFDLFAQQWTAVLFSRLFTPGATASIPSKRAGTRFTFESVVITQNLCAKDMSPEMFSRYSHKIGKYVMYIKILLLMIVIKL